MARRWLPLLAGFVALAVLLLLGCGSGSSTSPAAAQGAESEICGDLAGLSLALRKARGINTFSTADDAKEAQRQAQASLDDINESAQEYPEVDLEPLEEAVEEFSSVVAKLLPGLASNQTAAAIQRQAADVDRLRAQLRNELDCP